MLSKFKKKKKEEWRAYLNGELIPICQVPDEIFSTKMMGEGVAIIAESGVLCSPCDGTIVLIAPTKHAMAIKASAGIQALIHIGLDSAGLPENCFEVLVEEGNKVKQGQPLIKIASSYLATTENLYVPLVIVENTEQKSLYLSQDTVNVKQGESVILSYDQ